MIPVTGGGAARQVVMQPQAAPPQPLTLQRALTHPAPPPEQPSTQQPLVQGKRAPAQPVLKINSTNGGKFASKMQRRLIPLLRKSVPSCTIIVYNHIQKQEANWTASTVLCYIVFSVNGISTESIEGYSLKGSFSQSFPQPFESTKKRLHVKTLSK